MPTLTVEALDGLARRLLTAAGTPEGIAEVVAGILVDANLKGVDSHGVMQFPWYLEEIEKGNIEPAAEPAVERTAEAAALVRGNKGFGIYALSRASDLAGEIGVDLIAMASHRPALKDYLIGPNAARVVRHADVSVLVVRG